MILNTIDFTVREPLSISREPVVSNEIGAVDHIPATAIRGAYYQALMLTYAEPERGKMAELWLGMSGPRWSPAWPLNRQGELCVPMPKCFLRDKRDSGLGERHGLRNSLFDSSANGASLNLSKDGNTKLQWVRAAGAWLSLENGLPAGIHHVELESSMHVGLHYGRQTSRHGALFSRLAIAPDAKFRAFVTGAEALPSDLLSRCVIGKRRSAGQGLAECQSSQANSRLPWPKDAKPGGEILIQLLSDAIIAGPNGGYLRGLDPAAFKRLLGLDVRILGSASSSRPLRGWSSSWGCPREPVVVVEAGSCWRIDSNDAAGAARALSALQDSGLGLRCNEGFGWLAVNPPWLNAGGNGEPFHVKPQPKQTTSVGRPLEWPGFDAADRDQLRRLYSLAKDISTQVIAGRPKLKDRKDLVHKVEQLSRYAQHTGNANETGSYLNALAERENKHEWDKVQAMVKTPLADLADAKQIVFFLDAVFVLLNQGATRG